MTDGRGFYGKLPSRGDFLRAGLPRDFVQPWDDWLQAAIPASQALLGPGWVAAWMEAPIWRFCLPPGQCGAQAAIGVWMPSVDRAGRHFPLTLAWVLAGEGPGDVASWLDHAEAAGLAALEQDLAPDALTALLSDAPAAPGEIPLRADAAGQAIWWTAGAPLVPPAVRRFAVLPEPVAFAAMLDARHEPATVGMPI